MDTSNNVLRNGRELAARSSVHPDLEKERQNCPFSQEEITNLMDGGREKTAERRALEEYFFSFTEVRLSTDLYDNSHRYLHIFPPFLNCRNTVCSL